SRISRVIVATDDERIRDACRGFGAECCMTPASCPSGTDRVAKVAEGVACDLVVNVQGDEPELAPGSIDRLVELMAGSDAPMGTLAFPSTDVAQWRAPEVVKVVWTRAAGAAGGRALYFSRSGVPFSRADGGAPGEFWKHVGIYAYRRDFLLKLATLPPSPLERTEMLEQLRVLEAGFPIAVAEAAAESRGVDTPEQYAEFVVRWRLQHG
ncbi:MAG TPA: 3-deoxy-manno-octulosonate cytidylyltransferase, partial [Planctomycetota bacterium]|nr:3-deoxy-manno-octulosonate cytidylyltransferase [Planctomycetota bacterium]